MKQHRLGLTGVLCSLVSLLPGGAFAENALQVGSATAKNGATADIPLTLSGDGDVQGFIMVFEWDSTMARGVDVVPNDGAGQALNGADLVEKRVANGFLILAAVLDVDGQGGEKIPRGNDVLIGTAKLRCTGPTEGSQTVSLRLKDNKYARVDGGPLLSNLISIGGRSIGAAENLRLGNGSLVCEAEGGGETGPVMFACGERLDDAGKPVDATAARGERVTMNYYYKAPNGGDGHKDKIQGLSMSVQFSCDLTLVPDSFNQEGGALKEVNAEFVHIEVDNLPTRLDEDSCEFTLGVLVDAVAPYDGRTLPRTSTFRKLFSLDFLIEEDADCGKCYWLKFLDGLNGNGEVPVKNLVAINYQSVKPQLMNCGICVEGDIANSKFIRGDCNFSQGGRMAVDVADAAAMVGYFFLTGDWKFNAPCDDACDANDDGRLDAADVVFLLNYMFVADSPKPPKPGPTASGADPTQDALGCKSGEVDC